MPWNKRFTVNPGETVEQAVKREIEHIPVNVPLLNGIEVSTTVPAGVGWVRITHNLGRIPRGAIVTSCNSTTSISVNLTSTNPLYMPTETELSIYNAYAGTIYVRLWVF